MKAMILAAGLGTRLKPLTDLIPKPLVPVNNLPLIFYNLGLLKKFGIRDVVINLHHLGMQVKDLLGSGNKFGFRFSYSEEPAILGTGGGIMKAKSVLRNGPFLVLNSDIIVDVDLEKFLHFHGRQKSFASVVVQGGAKTKKYGVLYRRPDGSLASILEAPKQMGRYEKTFFTGIHLLDHRFFSLKIRQRKFCVIRDVYQPQLARGVKLFAYRYDGIWFDLGTFADLKRVDSALRSGRLKLSYGKFLDAFRNAIGERIDEL